MKIDYSLVKEDIVSCVRILQSTLVREVDGKVSFPEYVKRQNEPIKGILKAKAAAARLNVLLDLILEDDTIILK